MLVFLLIHRFQVKPKSYPYFTLHYFHMYRTQFFYLSALRKEALEKHINQTGCELFLKQYNGRVTEDKAAPFIFHVNLLQTFHCLIM